MRVPTYNTYDIYTRCRWEKYYNTDITTGGNFLATLYHGGLTTNNDDHFQGVVSGELNIWKGLKAKAVLGYDLRSEHRLMKKDVITPVYDYIDRDKITNESDKKDYSIEDYNGKNNNVEYPVPTRI